MFSEFIVNSNIVISFHHTLAMKTGFEDDEIQRQLKYKTRDMGVHSRVLQGVTYKGVIQSDEWVCVCSLYIHPEDNKKGMYTVFYYI